MKKNLLQRVIIIVVVTLLAVAAILWPGRTPTRNDFTVAGVNNILRKNINLGLDLRGGSHLVMQVQVQDYLRRLTENVYNGVQTAARDQGYDLKEVRPEINGDSYRVVVVANDASKVSEMRDQLPRKVNDFHPNDWSSSVSGNTITWELNDRAKTDLGNRATEDALKIIDTRINALGVTEPTLQAHGSTNSHQILLQMPGIDDPERIKELLKSESRLELMKVVGPGNPSPIQTYPTEEAARQSLGGTVPPNRQVLPYDERNEPTAAGGAAPKPGQPASWVVVESPAVIDGSELRSADAATNNPAGGDSAYQINFTLKPSGAQKFGAWTAANIGAYMAVVLNGHVKSAPFIKQQITDTGQISGSFTKDSAGDLALTLRSGALPAKIIYLEERTVGPSLGQDSIRAGVTASLVGLVLVVLTMVVYYRWSGINAVVALLLNTILTLAALILFNATLTLPGIAGIILGIGMAVDSNVLIFERIREELHSGKTVPSAIDVGFDRAFVTIIDTHVTTIVSSAFLFVFGTGPIRGFAVTLVLGLLANLFTAVYVSRTIFMGELSHKLSKHGRVESLSI
ncbi:MAG: preprotein translocase subunit SecD [Acidobacteriota bacterium]|jgi:preprotein translocase subunit SecD|nr:preprotein translocase subunit SecD [Acidobacteriota bacterium]